MAKDNKTISNADYEIRNAAKTLDVEPHIIHLAKSIVGNDREEVYRWVNQWRGLIFEVVIE